MDMLTDIYTFFSHSRIRRKMARGVFNKPWMRFNPSSFRELLIGTRIYFARSSPEINGVIEITNEDIKLFWVLRTFAEISDNDITLPFMITKLFYHETPVLYFSYIDVEPLLHYRIIDIPTSMREGKQLAINLDTKKYGNGRSITFDRVSLTYKPSRVRPEK